MKKIISTIIFLSFLSINIFNLTSCSVPEKSDNGDPPPSDGTPNDTIIVPEYKDYGRGTVNFASIEYSRPNIEELISDFDRVCEAIQKNELPFDEQLNAIIELEDSYSNLLTMRAYSNIRFQQNTADSYWSGENDYISTNYPAFSKAVEKLFVSAANSVHAENFENEYFGEDLIEDYRDGGIYTDRTVELMTREAELEAEYSSLSESTVKITYMEKTDTVKNILTFCEGLYGKDSEHYEAAEEECIALFESELDRLSQEILVELFKVRRNISDEFGYDSYATFAYDTLYHDYSESDFKKFTDDISEYIIPVYLKLSTYIFNQSTLSDKTNVCTEKLINNTGKMLKKADSELYEIYSYMLQHSLYDVKSDTDSRFAGAFTTYLDSFNAPFIFMTAEGNVTDYTTLCHEFGHFADMYINYAEETSLDLSEISSQALELLALTQFQDGISAKALNDLTVYELEQALSCLVFQGFYATFERIAYQIQYDDISEETLDEAVRVAAEEIGLNASIVNDLYFVSIPHVFLYPFYVQSYCTSVTAALEIYFAEIDDEGAGFEIYTSLLKRGDGSLNFEEELERVGLDSPFEEGYLRDIADRIHFKLLGSHYFKSHGDSGNAA